MVFSEYITSQESLYSSVINYSNETVLLEVWYIWVKRMLYDLPNVLLKSDTIEMNLMTIDYMISISFPKLITSDKIFEQVTNTLFNN